MSEPREFQSHAPQPHRSHPFDLAQAALEELHEAGFRPEFSSAAQQQTHSIMQRPAAPGLAEHTPDLRHLPWSSIDNDTSRDLDQIEAAQRLAEGIRVHVGIADVASLVAQNTPLDQHAEAQTQTVYTAVRNFPMLPVELSTDLTSLNQDVDRRAVVLSFTVGTDGSLSEEKVSLAWVHNKAQLAYSRTGPWLEGSSQHASLPELRADTAPQSSAAEVDTWLGDQLRLQDEATSALRRARIAAGALEFQRAEADPVLVDGRIASLHETTQNRAMHLIEDLMVAANGVMARTLRKGGRSALQRVVRVPQRWDRLVALAAEHGTELPVTPDPVALNHFLSRQRESDPDHYPDLAVGVIKLMGAGEYMLMRPDDDPTGHFGLAARDYSHSTAPNRRFPDLVTQRILHAMIQDAPPPYRDEDLAAIAAHCNEADKALRKIDRAMAKRVAAVAMQHRIGEIFRAVVTGASPKGVYARVLEPPFEGRIVEGEQGLDIGARVRVRLLHTDPARAFIDFARA